MFGFFKKAFIALLSFRVPRASIVNASYHAKCIPLNNQPCTAQSTVIILYPKEYFQELHYYQFTVNLDSYTGSFNILNDLYSKI